MRKTFLISIAIMAINVYALVCIAAAVISGIIVAVYIEPFIFYNYSWPFYTSGHLIATILLFMSEWDLTKVRVDSETIPAITVPFLVSTTLFVLAELPE